MLSRRARPSGWLVAGIAGLRLWCFVFGTAGTRGWPLAHWIERAQGFWLREFPGNGCWTEGAARIDLVNRMRSHITAAPQVRPGERAQSIVYEISYEAADAREAATVSNANRTFRTVPSLFKIQFTTRRKSDLTPTEIESIARSLQ